MRSIARAIVISFAGILLAEADLFAAAEFPIEYRDGLLWVHVQISGHREALNFLLDSGAQVSVINLDTAKRLGISLAQPVSVRGVRCVTTGYWPETLSATADGVPLPSEYLTLDLSRLNRASEQSVDGLIGADFFQGRIVQIDFEARKVRLLMDGEIPSNCYSIPLEVRPCGLCVDAGVNGNKLSRFRVDTGCAAALQWVTTSVRLADCGQKVAIGLAEINIPQTQTTVRLGQRTLRNVPTGLHREAIFEGESGLLGNGLLSRFKTITFDAKTGRLFVGDLCGFK